MLGPGGRRVQSKQFETMKRIQTTLWGAMLGIVAVGSSCVSRQAAAYTENQRDSLVAVVSRKDSLIERVFADLNALSENLALIRSREQLITAAEAPETGRRPIEELRSGIASIDRLLQENRRTIASLRRSAALLRKADLRIEGLEQMIAGLNAQLDERTAEAERLRVELARVGAEAEQLIGEVAARNAEIAALSGDNVVLQNRLHTVHYIVGSEKELHDAQIIDKQGFIGRTLTVGSNSRLDSFTAIDSRLLSEVPVGRKRATLVTAHPEGSFELVTTDDKLLEKIVITDPVRFWESSKILIVSYR